MPEHSTITASPNCPTCGGAMRTRQGSRGAFLSCTGYPVCRGTRSLPADTAPTTPRVEAATPSGALITDLRAAAGHIGRAVDILRRRGPEIDQLVDERHGVTF